MVNRGFPSFLNIIVRIINRHPLSVGNSPVLSVDVWHRSWKTCESQSQPVPGLSFARKATGVKGWHHMLPAHQCWRRAVARWLFRRFEAVGCSDFTCGNNGGPWRRQRAAVSKRSCNHWMRVGWPSPTVSENHLVIDHELRLRHATAEGLLSGSWHEFSYGAVRKCYVSNGE